MAPKSKTISKTDNALVALSSLFFVGGVAWAPAFYIWLYKKWKNTPNDEENKKKRKIYRNIFITAVLVSIFGPHRHRKVEEWINFRNWRIVKAWVNYMAYEVISESPPIHIGVGGGGGGGIPKRPKFDMKKDQAIFAIVPHGIVPFSIGFATLPQVAVDAFGGFRPVVASATRFLPGLRTVMEWVGCVDATRSSVERVLRNGERIGVSPGGIAGK